MLFQKKLSKFSSVIVGDILSPSSLSRNISKLENKLNLKLFVKNNKGITLTLDESFKENENDLHKVTFASTKVVFTGNYETLGLNLSIKEYANLCLESINSDKEALEYFDSRLPEIIECLKEDDLLILTKELPKRLLNQ